MAISLTHIDVRKGQSVIVMIDGSSERSLSIFVTKKGRCFVSGPFNDQMVIMELKEGGFEQVTKADREMAQRADDI